MKRKLLITGIYILIPLWTAAGETIHPWEFIEIDITSENELTNPYIDSLPDGGEFYLTAVFESTEENKKDKKITVPGFWDGGKSWKIRFAPPCVGKWTYRTISKDKSLDNHTGTLTCKPWTDAEKNDNPTRRGFVQVCRTGSRTGRYFEYNDGTPFLWIGDTWWNWTKRGIHYESFKKLADDRAAKGFSVGQLFFAGRGWGRIASLLNRDYSSPDLDHVRHVESYIRYANEKGITVWIHCWWGGKDISRTIGAENIRRWWRYAVHRLHAYNVIWVLAGEYNLHDYGGFDLSFWNDLGELIKREDPYDRIASVHPTPPGWGGGADAPQWSTAEVLHSQGWLDYNQSQVGHGRWRNEMIPLVVGRSYQTQPPKPIVVTEPWYEFIKDNPTAEEIRSGAWSAILSGAAGHSYAGGHIWKAHVPEAPYGKDSWPMELSFEENTLDYPGAKSLAFMAEFLRRTEWWKLEPHPELVIDNPSQYCGADVGNEYVVFLRYGGTVKIDLRDGESESNFHCQWIDLAEEKVKKERDITGGKIVEFHPPENYPGTLKYKDWILYIKKK